jgi:hypothetical protein
LFAVIVAIGLSVMAAFVAKSVSGPAAVTESPRVESTYSGAGPYTSDADAERSTEPVDSFDWSRLGR